ncbi:MAG: DUF481 domain-containing protein [Verrucomicrobia bacterium]|nr:DUF481 domain-containing protein [Verrucomicrobiota bacterium]
MKRFIILLTATLATLSSRADEIHTTDGFVLKGKVSSINSTTLTLETGPFGTLSIPRETVTTLLMDQPASVRLDDKSVWVGTVSTPKAGTIQVAGTRGSTSAELDQVTDLWPQGAEDPRIAAKQAELDAQKRNWKTEATVSVNGKSGNTTERNFAASVESVLSGPEDELKLYARYNKNSTDGVKSSEETIGGAQYSSFGDDKLGWYVRAELERDPFENIDLRTTVAGGPTYRWVNEDHYKLSGRSGLSYRQETYSDGTAAEGTLGLDLGLSHFYRFKNRWEIKNELTLLPSIQDFSNYLFTQDSSLALPIAASEWWKIKLGLRNDYNSQPGAGRDAVDTTYYGALSITRE